jgi:Leu/Phe-tRNA-protein transferase
MQFNEFQRRLEKCDFNREAMFLLSHMFEVQVEFSNHLDLTLKLIEQLTNKMQDVTHINSEMLQMIQELRRRGMADGVEVHSVRNDPDDV